MNSQTPDIRIIRFIKKHHIFTLATAAENKPWTATCFYAYQEEQNCLVFTTDIKTLHGKHLMVQPRVAGNIALETRIIGKIQGIQFTGLVNLLEDNELKEARKIYLKRFPMAVLMDVSLWGLYLTYIKMTDNRLGFGKKLSWPDIDGNSSESN